MILKLLYHVLSECTVVNNTHKSRAQFDIGYILDNISAHTAMDILDMPHISSVRYINILRKSFNIHKHCSHNNYSHNFSVSISIR